MDNRFSRRWSTTPALPGNTSSVSLPPTTQHAATGPTVNHVSFSKPSHSYSSATSGPGRPANQRWSSSIPTSSLAMNVQTIDYDSDETEIEADPEPVPDRSLKRSKSILNLRAIMRQIFSKKDDKEPVPPLPTKPLVSKTRSLRTQKSEPVLLKGLPEKETHLWNRLSVVVRPPKAVVTPKAASAPKRIDSGVDVQSLKSALKASKRDDSPSALSTTSLPTIPARQRTPSDSTSITLTGSPILLTSAERKHLVAELRHMKALVLAHSVDAESFSTNLAGLLWSKERYIVANKRISEETKLQMCDAMAKIRDTTAKTFARKGAFYERTLSVLEKVLGELGAGTPKLMSMGNASSSSLRSISPDSALSTSLTLTNSPTHSSNSSESSRDGSEKREYALTLPMLRSALQTLKTDLTAHSHLDPALRNGVVGPTKERKYPTTENEMIAMKRFVRFVEGRVKKLGEGYWEMGRSVRSLESWIDDLEESGC